MSIITKHRQQGLAARLGGEIRRRRVAIGMTQSELGNPLTRGFVSAVECGHCVPSVPVLLMFAERLHVSPGELLDVVNRATAPLYTGAHGRSQNTARHE